METIKDIVAELREHSGELFPPWLIYNEDGGLDVSILADRIEAVHKREQEDAIAATVVAAAKSASEVYEPHIQSVPVGNAAKMREALETISKCDISKEEDCYTLYRVCEAALSDPPRNCDKCLTPKDAMLAHLEEVYEGEKVEFGDYEWCVFVIWLFAEAKGEII